MRPDDLLDAIGEVRDDYVRDAKKQRAPVWIRRCSLAAVLALCVGLGGWLFLNIGGRAGNGTGSEEGLTYMSYEGPVFPLTLESETAGLAATRNVDFDFSPYETKEESYETSAGEYRTYTRYESASIITDSYLLTNSTAADMSVTAYYPFAANFSESEIFPQLTVNGTEPCATLHPGPYNGGFTGAYGAKNQESGSLNIDNISSFAGYADLLADGSYQASAFDAFPELDQPVFVYQMTDYVYSSDEEAENPTLQLEFHANHEKTMILTYGFNGFSRDRDSGWYALRNGAVRYRPQLEESFRHAQDAYLILLGEDIETYTLSGYRSGDCEEPLPDLGCTVLRYETTLGEILLQLLEYYTKDHLPILYGETKLEKPELYRDLSAELLTTYGALSGATVERYEMGMLEDIFSAVHSNERIFYLAFSLTVPAGETVSVEVVQKKQGSTDFFGKGKNRDGYDMATTLGSNLSFTDQTASLSGSQWITILRQNFGFDPENGVFSVTLDQNEPHYWLEVQKKPDES